MSAGSTFDANMGAHFLKAGLFEAFSCRCLNREDPHKWKDFHLPLV